MDRKKSILIVVLVVAAVVALWIFLYKKMTTVTTGGVTTGRTTETLPTSLPLPTTQLPKSTVTTPTVTKTVTYKSLPRDPVTGQVKEGTTELDTYCEQLSAEPVWWHVRWACYKGATHGQLTGDYYDHYDKYVKAPRGSTKAAVIALAALTCPAYPDKVIVTPSVGSTPAVWGEKLITPKPTAATASISYTYKG